jgi:D-glycero-D-manno-heptose 1,7-bisphosphate phosphatase
MNFSQKIFLVMLAKRKAAFIDRDGVVNKDNDYVYAIEDFIILPGVIDSLRLLRNSNYLLVLVTNQAGIARGYYDEQDLFRLHSYMQLLLKPNQAEFDAIYFCPHHPDGVVPNYTKVCQCRKPSPGMLLKAAEDLNLDLSQSILVGDKLSDINAGKRAGLCITALVRSGHSFSEREALQTTIVAEDLLDAALKIISYNKKSS